MPRRIHGERFDPTGRYDADWLPRPRKDIDYPFFDLPAEAERIKREIDGPAVRSRRPFRKAEWPTRRPTPGQAQIGDVLAGNIALRATCACGHSAVVDPALLSAKYDATTRIDDIGSKLRCTQCRRYGAVAIAWPDDGR